MIYLAEWLLLVVGLVLVIGVSGWAGSELLKWQQDELEGNHDDD